ncbi:MAG: type I-C CRISPR-associated protein Cas7/Csd2 [Oscillospiraceae bacterium]
MAILQNKIDFVVLFSVTNANPNGDPLDGNRPRTNIDGLGEMSDVSIKRKIRNRLQDMGQRIFVQSKERAGDGYASLSDRAAGVMKDYKSTDDEYAEKACAEWTDVRAFGQVFAFKAKKDKEKGEQGVSVPVRGPVSVHQVTSISPVNVNSMQITKSVNSETSEGKGADTMGMKHMVTFGLYKLKGSINVQLAEKTGFTQEDALLIKESLRTLFLNDTSSARPDGSMEILSVYWFEHNCKDGQYSAKKVHECVQAKLKDGVEYPKSAEDYDITVNPPEGLHCDEINGI